MSEEHQPQLKILCVGLCCLDIVNEVHHYPLEDTDQRCISQYRQRGGNASNNCTVLGILKAEPSFLGTIADTVEREFIENDFKKYGVNISSAVVVEGYECPNSYIILSKATGSRTIVHFNKNLPEVTYQQFRDIDMTQYSWIHFEGRNVTEVKKMMEHIQTLNKNIDNRITISVEIEKTKIDLKTLIPLADIIFVSKDFASMEGCQDMDQTLAVLAAFTAPHSTLICPWGDQGASALLDGVMYKSPPYTPEKVVDTLGAGDTFISATIYALMNSLSVEASINFGCKVAGTKIGVKGWEALEHSLDSLDLIRHFKKIRT